MGKAARSGRPGCCLRREQTGRTSGEVECEDAEGGQVKEGNVAKAPVLGVDPMGFLDGPDAVRRVQRYFFPQGKFSGRRFEFLGGGGARSEAAGEFTA